MSLQRMTRPRCDQNVVLQCDCLQTFACNQYTQLLDGQRKEL